MPYYRIHTKLDGQKIREFIIEDVRKDIDFVYMDYKKRVNAKNGSGRVIYFDLVMIANASLSCQAEREEVLMQENHYGLIPISNEENPQKKQKRNHTTAPSLGERMKK